ncbi:MAG: DUF2505 domain-containing protein [Deltaproteobacteria bacterium]|nr:DUF2505 domain-containing protein [Deltaproteobacteria bacterium]
MKIAVRHRFDCTVDQFWEMYWDPTFEAQMQKEAGISREILDEKREGHIVTRRVRITPDRELPGAVAALLGSKKLIYEQENRWDEEKRVLHWKVIPNVLPGKLQAGGTVTVRPAGTGCEQVVEGNIDVKVMLIGGRIEQGVVDEVTKSYDRTAASCRRWLEEKGVSS